MAMTKEEIRRRAAQAVAARAVQAKTGKKTKQEAQHPKKTAQEIQELVDGLAPKSGGHETIEEYMVRFKKKYQGLKLTEEDYGSAEEAAASQWEKKLKQDEKPEKKAATIEELAAQAAAGTGFTDLDTDVEARLYTVTREASTAIQQRSGAGKWKEYKDFQAYADGKTAAEAAEEAIAQLDLSGSQTVAHARHDFQPSSEGTINLQVQLGGSRNWRSHEGDTSWTMVTVTKKLWDAMKAADAGRWKSVIQAAHRASLADRQAIRIGPPPS